CRAWPPKCIGQDSATPLPHNQAWVQSFLADIVIPLLVNVAMVHYLPSLQSLADGPLAARIDIKSCVPHCIAEHSKEGMMLLRPGAVDALLFLQIGILCSRLRPRLPIFIQALRQTVHGPRTLTGIHVV